MTKVDGRQSPAIDKLNVPNSSITKGALQGKCRFGDILEGSVTGELNFIIISFFLFKLNNSIECDRSEYSRKQHSCSTQDIEY
jgi:hypothetical protein